MQTTLFENLSDSPVRTARELSSKEQPLQQTDMPDLPEGWKWVRLGKICEVVTGNTPPKSEKLNYGSEIPFVKPPQLFDSIVYETNEFLSIDGAKKARIAPPNSVMVTCIGNLGRTGLVKKESAFNQQINAIFENNLIGGKYIFYQAQSPSFRQQLDKLSSATTVAIVNKGKFETILIPLPPLPIQQAIVSKIEELFSELDKSIECLKTAQQQLKVYRQAVLKWAFEGKLHSSVRTGRDPSLNSGGTGRDPSLDSGTGHDLSVHQSHAGKSSPSENQENHGSDQLPEGWKWVKIGDICTNTEYGSAAKSKKEGRVPVLRMGNIQDGRFDWEDLVYTDDESEIKKYLLKKNDVLFNRTNSAELVGKTAIYKNEQPAIFAGYLIRIQRIESLIDGDYLTYFLNTHFARAYGNTVRSFGVNQSNINGTKLKSYPIPLAPREEQTKVVEAIEYRLSVADQMDESIRQSLEKAEALRQSILKKAFEGKLV